MHPGRSTHRTRTLALVAILTALLGTVAPATPATAATTCDRWVSDGGDDAAAGTTKRSALRTLSALAGALRPGETGCVTDGSVLEGNRTLRVTGTSTAPVTITVEPGGSAQVRGQTLVADSSHDLVLRGLRFTGLDLPRSTMLIVAGDRIRIERNELTSPLTICLDIKSTASRIEVVDNEVHHCGTEVDWTSQDSGAHGIYVQQATDVSITGNLVRDNAYRGVQTWPGADRVTIERNVFLRNGTHVNLGHDGDRVSRNVLVRDNVMADATLFASQWWKNVSSIHGYLPDGEFGNVVDGNCIHQAIRHDGLGEITGRGLTVGHNRILDRPAGLVGGGSRGVVLTTDSPCAGIGPGWVQPGAVACDRAGATVRLDDLDVSARTSDRGHWLRVYVRDAAGVWQRGPWFWRSGEGVLWRYAPEGWTRGDAATIAVEATGAHGRVWVLRYASQDGVWAHDWLSAGDC